MATSPEARLAVRRSPAPVVFVGPSIDRHAVLRALPRADVKPPIARGDLVRLRDEGAETFLIIDGLFAHRLAVSPSEVVAVARDGAYVLGAGSMGAIRAAECWPAGVHGVGALYTLYRLRVICDDAEVAVATDPDRGHAALSVPLINVRYAMIAALRQHVLSRAAAGEVLRVAAATHFASRHWTTLFRAADVPFTAPVRTLCSATDVKGRDARRAIAHLAELLRRGGHRVLATTGSRGLPSRGRSEVRYRGHDPYLGLSPPVMRARLMRWLFGSGRYRRYLTTDSPLASTRAGQVELWRSLTRTGALATETMVWHAVERGARLGSEHAAEIQLALAQRDIAEEHGYPRWEYLVARVRDGELGIPLEMINAACRSLALARTNLEQRDEAAIAFRPAPNTVT